MEKNKRELIGMKGWLLFFALIFTFIIPYMTIDKLFISPDSYSIISKLWLYEIVEIIAGTLSLLTGILIFMRSSKTRIALILFLLFFLLNSIIIHINTSGHDIKTLLEGILYSLALVTIVYLYFKKSVRVKNTLIR